MQRLSAMRPVMEMATPIATPAALRSCGHHALRFEGSAAGHRVVGRTQGRVRGACCPSGRVRAGILCVADAPRCAEHARAIWGACLGCTQVRLLFHGAISLERLQGQGARVADADSDGAAGRRQKVCFDEGGAVRGVAQFEEHSRKRQMKSMQSCRFCTSVHVLDVYCAGGEDPYDVQLVSTDTYAHLLSPSMDMATAEHQFELTGQARQYEFFEMFTFTFCLRSENQELSLLLFKERGDFTRRYSFTLRFISEQLGIDRRMFDERQHYEGRALRSGCRWSMCKTPIQRPSCSTITSSATRATA